MGLGLNHNPHSDVYCALHLVCNICSAGSLSDV